MHVVTHLDDGRIETVEVQQQDKLVIEPLVMIIGKATISHVPHCIIIFSLLSLIVFIHRVYKGRQQKYIYIYTTALSSTNHQTYPLWL